jgi:5'-AMP-activated protein kinase regulatory beta subunit
MGNAHAKRATTDQLAPLDDSMRIGSPPMPGSPLTYSPQLPMTPQQEPVAQASSSEYSGVAGWPAQPKLLPTVIVWAHGGSHVEVEGSFDNWTTRQAMQRSGKDFTIVKLLPPGVYQYKFVVDGEWKYAPDQPAMYDEGGNVNNVLEVQEYVPENLDSLSGFDPPPSPPSSYTQPLPTAEDYTKEPPPAPAHLQLTLLNVPPAMDATAQLPRPQHVVLNHTYCQRASPQVNALVLGTTHRYRSKYVTTVMYKPRRPPSFEHDEQAHGPVDMATQY